MNILKSKVMRYCACLLTSIFLVGALPWRELRADANTHGEYSCDPLSVTYEQSSSWETTTMGEFTITNSSDSTVDGWKFELVFASELSITNLWNGQDLRDETTPSNILIIGNEVYNSTIEPGASVSFGIIVTGSEFSPVAPNEVTLITDATVDEPEETVPEVTESEVDPTEEPTPTVTPSETITEDPEEVTVNPEPTEPEESEEVTPTPTTVPVIDPEIEDPYSDIDYDLDTDGDMVPDYYEEQIGTNPNDPDSDGDGLSDIVELLLGLDPTLIDTDGNGILDADEDTDEDGLSIIDELNLGTSPVSADTDLDAISDGDEVNIYGTDPLYYDSDSDGISDIDEISLAKDPLDESDNTVLVEQTMSTEINNAEDPAITSVDLSMSLTGIIDYSVRVNDVYGTDFYMTDVAGRIGSPISIDTDEEFDSAEITINYDEDSLGEVSEEDLGVLCYDGDTGCYTLLDQADWNHSSNSVKFNVNKFSTYILVDVNAWNSAMPREYSYDEIFYPVSDSQNYDVFFAFNMSENMTSSERTMILQTMDDIISQLGENDRYNFIGIDSWGAYSYYNTRTLMWNRSESSYIPRNIRYDVMNRSNRDGTAVQGAVLGMYSFYDEHPTADIGNKRLLIILTDDSVDENTSRIVYLLPAGANVSVYTLFIPDTYSPYAYTCTVDYWGGDVFLDCTDPDLPAQIMEMEAGRSANNGYGTTLTYQDDDNDGIPDLIERDGICSLNRCCNYFSDPSMTDSDGDSIPDGDELGEQYLIWKVDDETVNINGNLLATSEIANGYYAFLEQYIPSESGNVRFVTKMTNNPGSSDSNNNGISDDSETNGEIVYIFYGDGKNDQETRAFENEANFRERWCEDNGYVCVNEPVQTKERFFELWNGMGVKDDVTYSIDSVFYIGHSATQPTVADDNGQTYTLYCMFLSDGQIINISDVAELQPKTIEKLYLNACYLGHRVVFGDKYTEDNPVSFAESFLYYQNIEHVYAADGVCGALIVECFNENDFSYYDYTYGIDSADYTSDFECWLLIMKCGDFLHPRCFYDYYIDPNLTRTESRNVVPVMTWTIFDI